MDPLYFPSSCPRPIAEKSGRICATPPARPLLDRRTALARVLPLFPHELEDESQPARRKLAQRLRRALRAERRRGIAGHWTYDLARHVELLRLYRLELAALPRDPQHCERVRPPRDRKPHRRPRRR